MTADETALSDEFLMYSYKVRCMQAPVCGSNKSLDFYATCARDGLQVVQCTRKFPRESITLFGLAMNPCSWRW